MEEKKYNFELTKTEVRMIRIALMLEVERREEMHNSKAKDYAYLENFFSESLKTLI
jgi:hypothetical protein